MTWTTLITALACLILGARLGFAAGTRQDRPCRACQERTEIAQLNHLYEQPAYGDD